MSDVTKDTTIDLHKARSAVPGSDSISSIAVGRVLRDRYVLQARLGTGGRGAVFRALDRFRTTLPETQQYVALKILHAEGDCSEETLANLRLEFYCGQVLSHRKHSECLRAGPRRGYCLFHHGAARRRAARERP